MPPATPVTEAEPSAAPTAPPLGSRLWLYTNFSCNLACDYCCAESSPRATPRLLPVEVARRAAEELAGLGGRDLLLTGGEPFLHPQLGELVEACARYLPVTILTNAMVLARGSRRRTLEALNRERIVMQVSLDSGTPALHDRHRGRGSFARARAGIALLRELGFRVRVAATIDAADASEEAALHRLLDADGVPPHDRLVRPVARTGFATWGVDLDLDRLWPEPALAVDGAWWHPVAVADPRALVSSTPLPVVTTLAVIRATLNDPTRDRAGALEAFRCT
jgi:MoaA/NifB/PqqE/SkfB family radical SAM enzyme